MIFKKDLVCRFHFVHSFPPSPHFYRSVNKKIMKTDKKGKNQHLSLINNPLNLLTTIYRVYRIFVRYYIVVLNTIFSFDCLAVRYFTTKVKLIYQLGPSYTLLTGDTKACSRQELINQDE